MRSTHKHCSRNAKTLRTPTLRGTTHNMGYGFALAATLTLVAAAAFATAQPVNVVVGKADCDKQEWYVGKIMAWGDLSFSIDTAPNSGFIFDVLGDTYAYFEYLYDEGASPGKAYIVTGKLGEMCS